MHLEVHRLLKAFIFQFLIHFPTLIIITYLYFGRLDKDILFALIIVGINILLFYIFDWGWHHKTEPAAHTRAISIFVALGIIIIGTLIYCIIANERKKQDEKNRTKNNNLKT